METNKIYQGHVHEVLKDFPDGFIQTIVSSPPYYALRDYDLPKSSWPEVKWKLFGVEIITPAMECCLGLEDDPKHFIAHLVLIYREAKRTLMDNGTIWVNMGDSYWGGKGKSGQSYSSEYQNERYNAGRSFNGAQHQIAGVNQTRPTDRKSTEYKPKDLMGIPFMLAFALRSDGWYLRQDIIWSKPNPMPESATDRCTKSHEYIFLLSKSSKYYYDAKSIATPYKDKTLTTYGAGFKSQGDGSGLIQSENWANSLKERKPKQWNHQMAGIQRQAVMVVFTEKEEKKEKCQEFQEKALIPEVGIKAVSPASLP